MIFMADRILKHLIIALCENDTDILSQVDLAVVVTRIRNFVKKLPGVLYLVFYINLFFLEFALPPVVWKIRPFTWLNLQQKLDYLGSWQSSRFGLKRTAFELIKRTCLMHLYSEKTLLKHMGFGSVLTNRAAHSTQPGERHVS